ncbi:MAG: hypothetical protein FWC28_05935 [Proteobacteria bacterium]|nr:hypothetical protein [Pseudomonadota bacterium]
MNELKKTNSLRKTLLRSNGAIQMLEEKLQKRKVEMLAVGGGGAAREIKLLGRCK